MALSQKAISLLSRKNIDWFLLYSSLIISLGILFHLGFTEHSYSNTTYDRVIVILFYVFAFILITKTIRRFITENKIFKYSELLLCLYFLLIIIDRIFTLNPFSDSNAWIYFGFFSVFLVEVSKNVLFFDRFYFNPTLLFALSFLLIITLGTMLLLLPASTKGLSLSIVDSLFMATSAVCITGLSIVDVSTQFSHFGQIVLLCLVQLGGLGMLTFTGFFGYFFSGGFSYKNQIMYLEILGENKIGKVINTLIKIVVITLSFEAFGALLIYLNTSGDLFENRNEHMFFSIFHSVSAFCNAGFSNYEDGLYNENLRFNYPIQLIIASLFILGGLGFGIISNVYGFIKRWAINIYNRLIYKMPFIYRAWVISFNSRLIAWSTFLLLAFGSVITLLLEYNHTLAIHKSFWGKLTAAFFIGASPRTAGFNNVDMTELTFPTIFIIIILMWIGASPGSTGGGIKTTTFAVSILNFVSIARGKERIEVFGREISHDSIRRAFAIITLSLVTISISIFALSITDGEQKFMSLVFETFSAFSTVGLSLGITPTLSNAGKVILVCCMFVGRIGTLTLLLAIFNKKPLKSYLYPSEKVLF